MIGIIGGAADAIGLAATVAARGQHHRTQTFEQVNSPSIQPGQYTRSSCLDWSNSAPALIIPPALRRRYA
jgi:hypothetical protein